MVEFIPPPEPEALLPPLLACLPTAFVASRPPPVLLPLLSPILRQRVQIFSSVSTSSSDSWLRLLCWGDEKADRVSRILDGVVFEPHPVSGEIEVPEELSITFKRLDEETLRSKLHLPEYRLSVLYVWCSNDPDGGGPGWRIAELQPSETADQDHSTWSRTISEANDHARERMIDDAIRDAEASNPQPQQDDDDDDDDYWAQYDNNDNNTPGRTPSAKSHAFQPSAVSEDAYYSQYAEVQPAMDNHDPSEDTADAGESSLNGDIFSKILQQHARARESRDAAPGADEHDHDISLMSHPRPASASSGSTVAKLELEAENQSASEVAVKQHIGTSIKSLYRLAKTTGMSRAEFRGLIQTEVELLSLSDED